MKTTTSMRTRLFNMARLFEVSTALLLALWLVLASGASAQTFNTLVSFNGTDGAGPGYVYLVQGRDGDLYGTTEGGAAGDYGTVFRITTGGTLTTLHSFAGGTDGSAPCAGLVLATDGNFYGTTSGGGTYNNGTVFQIAPSGTLTTLHSFNGSDGAEPESTLVQASDGNLYGTTNSGGANNDGTVFQMTPAGTLTTLHSFDGTDGARPLGGVIQASDGNFYGTTVYGGLINPAYCPNNGCGTVFKITPAGTLTTLHNFAVTDGFLPYSGLVQATDGNFYGTTRTRLTGCMSMCGTVFKITPAGSLTVLHNFTGWDGSHPTAALIQATDGNFYGTTFDGTTGLGPGNGNVFEITPTGTLTTMHFFDGSDGSGPWGGVFQAADGKLYGTTISGGANGDGTVYSLSIGGAATGDFAIAVDPTTVTINSRGAQGTMTLTVTPSDGFNQTITFNGASCTGLPEGATCSFNPQSVTPSGGPASTELTIATTAASAAIPRRQFEGAQAIFLALAVPGLLVLGAASRRKRGSAWQAARMVLGVVLVACSLSSLNGCSGTSNGGGKGGGWGTPPGTYTVTVTATASNLSHATSITLVVQ